MRRPRLLSPVFGKEMAQLAHGWRLQGPKLAVLVVLLVITLAVIVDRGIDQARLGRELFALLSVWTAVLIAVLAPLVVAGVVCGERQANTLGLLLLTRLSRWQIVQDKGLSRLSLLAHLAVLVAPFCFGALLFGGVETPAAVAVVGLLLTTVLQCGAVCLFASAVCSTVGAAVALAYALELGLGALGIAQIVLQVRSAWSLAVGPEWCIYAIAAGKLAAYEQHVLVTWPWALVGNGGLYLVAVAAGACLLDDGVGPAGTGLRLRHWRAGLARAARTVFHVMTPIGWIARLPAAPPRNPVAWRVGRLTGPRLLAVRLALLIWWVTALLVVMFITFKVLYSGEEVTPTKLFFYGGMILDVAALYVYVFALCTPVLALFMAVVAACATYHERQAGTWEVLLSTRLTGARIVMGYWLGLAKAVVGCTVVVGALMVAGRLLTSKPGPGWFPGSPVSVVVPTLAVLLYGLLVVTIGLRCSLVARTPLRAVLLTLAALVVVCCTPYLLDGLTYALFEYSYSEFWYALSPIHWCESLFDGVVRPTRARKPWESEGNELALLLVHVLAMLWVVALALLDSCARFDRLVGRQGR